MGTSRYSCQTNFALKRAIMTQTQQQDGHFTGHPLFLHLGFEPTLFFIIMMSFHRKTLVHKHILNLLQKSGFTNNLEKNCCHLPGSCSSQGSFL